jgi:hypothetical protein
VAVFFVFVFLLFRLGLPTPDNCGGFCDYRGCIDGDPFLA